MLSVTKGITIEIDGIIFEWPRIHGINFMADLMCEKTLIHCLRYCGDVIILSKEENDVFEMLGRFMI